MEAVIKELKSVAAHRNLLAARNTLRANTTLNEDVKTAAVNALTFQLYMSSLVSYTNEFTADRKLIPVTSQYNIDINSHPPWMV